MFSRSILAGLAALLVAAPMGVPAQKRIAEPDVFHARPQGGLSGATVFVSPGHGWMYSESQGRFITQRGITHGMIEDHSNAEAVLQFLVPYLWNAGAEVETTRERDMQTNMVIVENGGTGYSEKGNWTNDTSPGAHEDSQRVAKTVTTDPAENAEGAGAALFLPTIPEDGYYAVYAWYAPVPGKKMAEDAHYVIRHTGGTTIWKQDQNIDGRTWQYMGRYYFEAGDDREKGSVTLLNYSAERGRVVAADAVRFGGGMGDVPAPNGQVSGKPRWEESGLYYAPFMGYTKKQETRNVNTVSAMPMFAEWESEAAEKGKSIYIGWHTNASGGKSRGLFSFIYGPDEWAGIERFTGYPGGVELCTLVHNEIMNDVHAAFDPNWRSGAIVTRWLGETNPRNNNEMPAALFEMGFHDNAEDAAYIVDPRFRQIVARAVYHGIVKYYRENVPGFENAKLLPEPPINFAARVTGDDTITLSWHEPPFDSGDGLYGDPATGYRVYRSTNGKGFDNGFAVRGNGAVISKVKPGETLYFRVTATNDGGESFPTETLAVRVNPGKPEVLLVNAFDRLDRDMNLVIDGAQRGIIAKMNSRDYVIQHASAIPNDYAISSSSNEAVSSGTVRMSDHDAVVWMLGQERGEEALSQQEQLLLRGYLHQGNGLMISGSEAAAGILQSDRGPEFMREILRVRLEKEDSGSRTVASADDSLFAGIGSFTLDDGSGATYPVKWPDVVAAAAGADAVLTYADGSPAATQYAANHRVLYFGFPFETINEAEARGEIMRRALEFLVKTD